MKLKTEYQTFRFTSEQVETLNKLVKFRVKKSNFVRDAIKEKIERDYPKLLAEKRRLDNLIKYPF
jgi:predicted DNA-binding protein